MTETVKSAAKAKVAAKPEPKKVVVKAAVTEKVPPVVTSNIMTKADKPKKLKLVRDSFTMPQHEYAHIAAIKERCLKAGVSAKKSEVLRAALACISRLSDKDLVKAISELEGIKTGRPAKA